MGRRDSEGESLPSLCILSASDQPEKNFSAMFALGQLENHRILSRHTCDLFIEEKTAVALVENIPFDNSNDFNPYLYIYVPIKALEQCVKQRSQPIFLL